ncbi:MAG: ABC-2 transporter permease [Lachnospiraceae bacterium]|nr:ABC-2 transporter permease [Lachnospiraceae bacterium]
MKAIYLKELKGYFHSMTGYVYLAFFTVAIAIYYVYYCVLNAMTNFTSYVLGNVTIIFLIAIPILTMRLLSEEKKQRTDQLLFTAPVRTWEIVVGKYLAALTLFTISLLIIGLFPIFTSMFGKVNWLMTLTGLLGTFLLGAGLIAIGLLISCTTEHQMIAAVLSFALFLVMFMLPYITEMFPSSGIFTMILLIALALLLAWMFYEETKDFRITAIAGIIPIIAIVAVFIIKPELYDNGLANIISWLSLMDRFNNFVNGVLNASSIVYYCSFVVVSLFVGTQILEHRRWK